jgi:hypothetical protein
MKLRGLLAFGAVLLFGLAVTPAFGQQGNAMTDHDDYIVNGVKYRVPRTFRHNSLVSRETASEMPFAFWVSDRAPARIGAPDQGAAAFWPPEPGRPSESSEDFVATAVAVVGGQHFIDQQQASLRSEHGEALVSEYGLDCYRPRFGALQCITEANRDPAAHFALPITPHPTDIVQMSAFSSKDGVGTYIFFPMIGMPKWAAVLCQTYALLRTWRVSAGPPPDNCKSPLPSR